MSVKKTVESTAKRLAKVGNHKEGDLHHLEIHPAENGFTVEHHFHGKKSKGDSQWGPSNPTSSAVTVHESAKKAMKHCQGICDEHEKGSQVQPSEDGKLIGKNDHKDPEEEGESGY
jgi:hypothetical protein